MMLKSLRSIFSDQFDKQRTTTKDLRQDKSATGDILCTDGATYITITLCLCGRQKQENVDLFKQNSLSTSQKFEETNCCLRTGCPNMIRGYASLSSQKSKQIVSILNQSDWDTSSPPCLEILK